MLDLNIIVAEVDWSSSELLTIEGDIDGVLQLIWVEIGQVGDLGDDFSVFKVTFSGDPVFLVID